MEVMGVMRVMGVMGMMGVVGTMGLAPVNLSHRGGFGVWGEEWGFEI